jgi:Asp-tRNA(Asn)/Glu-tRNA(Gln) amidotransferase C subunit
MARRLGPADVALLAELAGLRLPPEDLEALAEALGAHLAFVAPLLNAELDDVNPSLTHDPRWRD